MYAEDFTWLNHSLTPTHISSDDFRVSWALEKRLRHVLAQHLWDQLWRLVASGH